MNLSRIEAMFINLSYNYHKQTNIRECEPKRQEVMGFEQERKEKEDL